MKPLHVPESSVRRFIGELGNIAEKLNALIEQGELVIVRGDLQ